MRDARYENWLSIINNVAFEYLAEVPIGEINKEESLKNQARHGGKPLDDNRVFEMALAIESGAEMPAVICYEHPTFGKVLITGNHRHAAHLLAGKSVVDCYLVQVTDAKIIDLLTRTANSVEGMGQSREQNLHHIKYLVDQGLSVKDIARRFNYSEENICLHLRSMEVRAILVANGIPARAANELPNATCCELYKLRHDHSVMIDAGRLLIKESLNSSHAKRLCAQLSSVNTHQEKVDVMATFGQQREVKRQNERRSVGLKIVRKTKAEKLVDLLSGASKVLADCKASGDLGIKDDDETNHIAQVWQSLAARYYRLLGNAKVNGVAS